MNELMVDLQNLYACSDAQLHQMCKKGLDPSWVGALAQHLNISTQDVLDLAEIPRSTFTKRRKAGKLNQKESEIILRFLNLFCTAFNALGDKDAAARWLQTPSLATGEREVPLMAARDEFGAREIERILNALKEGIYL